jgi:hypothetical protein
MGAPLPDSRKGKGIGKGGGKEVKNDEEKGMEEVRWSSPRWATLVPGCDIFDSFNMDFTTRITLSETK